MDISIKVEKREKLGKLDSIRKKGFIPAVYYGHKKESRPIQMKMSDFIKTWKNAGESGVVKMDTPDGEMEALIHKVDIDPINSQPVHADFYVFEKGHKVEISIPLEFEGVSPAIKNMAGILVKVMHELKIKAEPSNLPHSIKVDIGSLINLDSQIIAKEINLPKGVELMQNPEEVVALVSVAKEEKEENEEAIDLSKIEVEKKGKTEEEGEVAVS